MNVFDLLLSTGTKRSAKTALVGKKVHRVSFDKILGLFVQKEQVEPKSPISQIAPINKDHAKEDILSSIKQSLSIVSPQLRNSTKTLSRKIQEPKERVPQQDLLSLRGLKNFTSERSTQTGSALPHTHEAHVTKSVFSRSSTDSKTYLFKKSRLLQSESQRKARSIRATLAHSTYKSEKRDSNAQSAGAVRATMKMQKRDPFQKVSSTTKRNIDEKIQTAFLATPGAIEHRAQSQIEDRNKKSSQGHHYRSNKIRLDAQELKTLANQDLHYRSSQMAIKRDTPPEPQSVKVPLKSANESKEQYPDPIAMQHVAPAASKIESDRRNPPIANPSSSFDSSETAQDSLPKLPAMQVGRLDTADGRDAKEPPLQMVPKRRDPHLQSPHPSQSLKTSFHESTRDEEVPKDSLPLQKASLGDGAHHLANTILHGVQIGYPIKKAPSLQHIKRSKKIDTKLHEEAQPVKEQLPKDSLPIAKDLPIQSQPIKQSHQTSYQQQQDHQSDMGEMEQDQPSETRAVPQEHFQELVALQQRHRPLTLHIDHTRVSVSMHNTQLHLRFVSSSIFDTEGMGEYVEEVMREHGFEEYRVKIKDRKSELNVVSSTRRSRSRASMIDVKV